MTIVDSVENEGPAVLQLQKWDHCHIPLSLSEICEAHISPSREILLLLSHIGEALLLPLGSGKCQVSKDLGSLNSGSGFSNDTSRLDSLYKPQRQSQHRDPIPSHSSHTERYQNILESCPFLCDVKSLAWFYVENGYDMHNDPFSHEILVTSGTYGITAHIFSSPPGHIEEDISSQEHRDMQGRWVNWGPSETIYNNFGIDPLSFDSEALESSKIKASLPDGNLNVGIQKSPDTTVRSKKWLRSFLTSAQTTYTDNKMLTKFPEKCCFPCSENVVSFRIFENNLVLMEFLSHSRTTSDQMRESDDVGSAFSKKSIDSTQTTSANSNPGINVLRCLRVLSCLSNRMIGLVLELSEPLNSGKIVIVIGVVFQWGIDWISFVELPDHLMPQHLEGYWADFQFFNEFLFCLGVSGLLSVWVAATASFVATIDVLNNYLCSQSISPIEWSNKTVIGVKLPGVDDLLSAECDDFHEERYQEKELVGKRSFRKLMVSPCSTLLAVVDEYGVVYIICTDDLIPEEHHPKPVVCLQLSRFGTMTNWDIAGSEISSHKTLHDSAIKFPWINLWDISFQGNMFDERLSKWNMKDTACEMNGFDSYLNGFSSIAQIKVQKTDYTAKVIRRVFLPVSKSKPGDSIWFSTLGVTRLVKGCSIKKKSYDIIHTSLYVSKSAMNDEMIACSRFNNFCFPGNKCHHVGEVVGCSFQGNLYLVSNEGISIVLPSISVASRELLVDSLAYFSQRDRSFFGSQDDYFVVKGVKSLWNPWKMEILNRMLVGEGIKAAENLCLENGWDMKFVRMRYLQLALDFLQFDEIDKALEKLVEVSLAADGILRLLYCVVYQIICKTGSDNEVVPTSRLLALASRFATRMVKRYGLLERNTDRMPFKHVHISTRSYLQLRKSNENLRKLNEMSHFLEIIRTLQNRVNAKSRRPVLDLVEAGGKAIPTDFKEPLSDLYNLSITTRSDVNQSNGEALDVQHQRSLSSPENELTYYDRNFHEMSSQQIESSFSLCAPDERSRDNFDHETHQESPERKISLENPMDMIKRWRETNLDLKTVIEEALHAGRMPLAVLQLHLQRKKNVSSERQKYDDFSQVQEIGRTIAYNLLLKGETGLAIEALKRLGDDFEVSLRKLAFGTVKKPLRTQLVVEMKQSAFLQTDELHIFEKVSNIERLYPNSSFWGTYHACQKLLTGDSFVDFSNRDELRIVASSVGNNIILECGEIDGSVLSPWDNIEQTYHGQVDEVSSHVGYWAGAAIWTEFWDQNTMDRIVLDQPFCIGIHIPWESQLEYHICHNDWVEVSKLLDDIPLTLLEEGSLYINLQDGCHSSTVGCNEEILDYAKYKKLNEMSLCVPNVKLFRLPSTFLCNIWLETLMEQKLAKKLIFMKEYWEGTDKVIALLARAQFITDHYDASNRDFSALSVSRLDDKINGNDCSEDSIKSFHKLIIYHCAQNDLPTLMDLYLDQHRLDDQYLDSLLHAAGECQWAKWLLLSRVKGKEFDASFSNARSIMCRDASYGENISLIEVEEIVQTIDEIAEGGGEMAALATLMYAPIPIEKCLCIGGLNRRCSSSSQCTLENLRPGLQQFPTLWKALVSSCLEQDSSSSSYNLPGKNAALGKPTFSDYLNWRYNIFSSSDGDTSLIQMFPTWCSKHVKRLIQLFVQGPLGWSSLSDLGHRDIDFIVNAGNIDHSATSWEAAIQRNIEKELYCSVVANDGIVHHLYQRRALAAFNHILSTRIQRLKSTAHHSLPGVTNFGQRNIQKDVQVLLAPLSQNEESLLASVVPLALEHFEDSGFVASCCFLLELCGLSSGMLHVDVAALQRISSFYQSMENINEISIKGAVHQRASPHDDVAASLATALAEDYQQAGSLRIFGQNDFLGTNSSEQRQISCAILAVLYHLEKASLPLVKDGSTCGSWLLNGVGNGFELQRQQRVSSQRWNLVSVFCQMHQIPLSTKYLTLLAKENDWVGFLSEAQVRGFPSEVIIQVASEDFSDKRLQCHILNVLRGMRSSIMKKTDSVNMDASFVPMDSKALDPIELFGILGKCEQDKNPGTSLLLRAKDMRWPLLAMIASCFPDASPLKCLTVWLEITASREISSIKMSNIASQIGNAVGAAVEATNTIPTGSKIETLHYNRMNAKRRKLMDRSLENTSFSNTSNFSGISPIGKAFINSHKEGDPNNCEREITAMANIDELDSVSKIVSVLCEHHCFLPLLRAFEMFLPACALLPFLRSLQAFTQMRLSEASAHLASFSARMKEEPHQMQVNVSRERNIGAAWIRSTALKAAEAVLSKCPSAYEKRCLLQLLASTDFGDGGSISAIFWRNYWKINLAEPCLRKIDDMYLGEETLDDASLLTALEKSGRWDQARKWAKQLESSDTDWASSIHHVTEMQAEAMVREWKEFLWDVPEEREALWGHCQKLFVRYSFPALKAGEFFIKQAEAIEKDNIPAKELHEILVLALQWLSGSITKSNPVHPLHLLRDLETRIWLLAVEVEVQAKKGRIEGGNSFSIVEKTASIITRIDSHLHDAKSRMEETNGSTDKSQIDFHNIQSMEVNTSIPVVGGAKAKRRTKSNSTSRPSLLSDDDAKMVPSSSGYSGWKERIGPAELERAILSLLEFGQITAAKQLQQKFSPLYVPSEMLLVDVALKLATMSSPSSHERIPWSLCDEQIIKVIQSYGITNDIYLTNALEVLENLTTRCNEGCGRVLCKRITAVLKGANVLGLSFSEAFDKQPIQLFQLLSLKAQDSFEEAKLLVQTHWMHPSSIAQILAESFLKGLLAAHRGGYMDLQREEGPAPLLWRISDFIKWSELCPSEAEIGHALMRLVITGQEIPHACEVELLILSHHFYKSSACLDGVDVLISLAATRVEPYVLEGEFACLARLVTGVGNFRSLSFILRILVENGQLELLLQKYSSSDASTGAAETIRGFRMAVLSALTQFNPNDLDAFATVYNHFDMKYEMAYLLESRATEIIRLWRYHYDREHNEELLQAMHFFIEAAEVHSTIDAGNKTHHACSQASLLSLQIRMPDFTWLGLSETNARRMLVEQCRFQEAFIVAEAYGLNESSEWALVLWNQMLKPELTEKFVAEFVAVLPLHPTMLGELARFYRAEVAARGEQSQFSMWLSPGGGLRSEWVRHLGRSFRSLLKRTRDLRIRIQLATVATGFGDVIDSCAKILDKMPDNAGPLLLRRGHGGAYLPLM